MPGPEGFEKNFEAMPVKAPVAPVELDKRKIAELLEGEGDLVDTIE